MKKFSFMIGFILILILVSCGKEEYRDLKQSIAKLKEDVSLRKKSSPPQIVIEPKAVAYQKETLRTPFEDTLVATAQGSASAALNPMQRYPINLLKFLGTVSMGNRSYAYLGTPDNKIFQVTIGDKIGNHNGTIVKIAPNEIQISEPLLDEGKGDAQRIVTLQLKDES